MPRLFRDRHRHAAPALVLCALLCAPNSFAAAALTGKIEFRFDGGLQMGTGDDTVAGEKITLTQDKGTLITAAKAQGSWSGTVANSQWKLSGKVHIEYDTMVLDADTATVVFANNLVQSIETHGAPVKFSRPGKVAARPFKGSGDTIVFDGTKRQVSFTGHSWFSQVGVGESNSGRPLVYELDSGVLRGVTRGGPAAPITIAFNEGARMDVRFDGNFTLGTNDDTMAGEQITITQDKGTSITAAKAQGSWTGTLANGRWTLTGKVHTEHDQTVLDADTATVTFASGVIRSIDVHGKPALFTHPVGTAGERYQGRADTIEFDGVARRVRFCCHSWYSFNANNEGTSDKPLVYDIDKDVLHSEDDGNAEARIRGTLRPDKKRVPAPRTPDRSTAQ